MEITFLLGNGLDLNCGCKSSYRDIYEYYLTQPSPNEWVKRLKNTISKNIETWGDFEMAMAQYVASCKSSEEAIACIRDFKKQMDKYLVEEDERIGRIVFESHVCLQEIEKSLKRFFWNNFPNEKRKVENLFQGSPLLYHFVSFNYTSFLDSLIIRAAKDIAEKSNKVRFNIPLSATISVNHIHGTLRGNELLGVDNIEQIGSLAYDSKSLERVFVKPTLNSYIDPDRVEDAMKAIDNADIICVFGMSLGDSDYSWRKRLIEWLEADSNHHLFLYVYSRSCAKTELNDEKLENEEEAKEEFIGKAGINNPEIKRQIHIPIGSSIFNIKEKLEEEARQQIESEDRMSELLKSKQAEKI